MAKKLKRGEEKQILAPKFTKNQTKFLDALRENLAIISKAADSCGMHRNNHFHWMKTNERYKAEYESIEEDCLDVAENALMNNIINGDTTAIIFYLKTKAKKRGYIEKTETDFNIKREIQLFKIGGQEIQL
jgi:hypothetical protein